MSRIQNLVKDIIDTANDPYLSQDEKEFMIAGRVRFFVDDVLEIKNNIDNTSLSDIDRLERCIYTEKYFGINKTHLLK